MPLDLEHFSVLLQKNGLEHSEAGTYLITPVGHVYASEATRVMSYATAYGALASGLVAALAAAEALGKDPVGSHYSSHTPYIRRKEQ